VNAAIWALVFAGSEKSFVLGRGRPLRHNLNGELAIAAEAVLRDNCCRDEKHKRVQATALGHSMDLAGIPDLYDGLAFICKACIRWNILWL
jgi:hypothetical protein